MISDVDGTLLRPDKTLSPATIEAAHRLSEAGIAMSLISARAPSGILPLAEALGLRKPIAAFNGGTMTSAGGILLRASRLSADASRTAIALFSAAAVTIWVFADGKWFVSNDTNPHNLRERRNSALEPIVVSTFEPLHGRIDKIVAVSDDFAYIRDLEARAKKTLGARANVTRSQDYFCDVTHPAANKGAGVARLAAAIGVPLSRMAIIGDMPNDLPMLQRAGFAIAMGQAPAEVKAAAQWTTRTNSEDGLAFAIECIIGSQRGAR
ncbi:MAG: HAD family hydrolase [Sphingomonas bacterium]